MYECCTVRSLVFIIGKTPDSIEGNAMARDVVLPEQDKPTYEAFHFAPAVRASGLLICSGQIGTNPDGSVPDSPQEEFRNAWAAVGRILAQAGLSYDDIVETTTYHVNLHEHLESFMAIRDEIISPPWPAWTAIGISELAVPGARVEIRVMAEV
jgi:enamine deaminase RidA (YjgF/YER057c/UK114 family)